MSDFKSTKILSPATLAALSIPISTLCFLFFYLSLASFIFASAETIFGILQKDDHGASWWRRSRLVALTYAQMYLSQHFLHVHTLPVGNSRAELPEKNFWMASQTIAAGVVLFSVLKPQNTTGRLLIGRCYKIERPQLAQLVLTSVVTFNIHLIAGPLAAIFTGLAILICLDWRIVALFFESMAIWKASKGVQLAAFAWGVIHMGLAFGIIQAIHNFDQQEGLITLPLNDEENARSVTATAEEKSKGGAEDSLYPLPNVAEPPSGFLITNRLFIMLCALLILAGAVVATVFFGLEKFLLPNLLRRQDRMTAEGLVLSHMFTTETIAVALILILTVRELSGNWIVQSILHGLT
ncbi:hypothetical protein TWF730_006070 [Orbilia blumenaviensis]|uniref:Uncharacterized protein n=1 Tax=Orbilia blumenaviensis TaxID=1796055 RepID=A0AAV9VK87_9PEZI